MSLHKSQTLLLTLILLFVLIATGLWFYLSGFMYSEPAIRSALSPSLTEANLPPLEPQYVGVESCRSCHEVQFEAWRDSHHDLAMQVVSEETVLGDFGDALFTHGGITSTFSNTGDRFMVQTDGPDGTLQNFEIKYTFGVIPLQQYLVELQDGKIQALSIAWDSRPVDQGGQKWFHLYPDEQIDFQDELHWTKPSQNWNYMCAECHSTHLQKNYDAENNRYQTNWAEINVACEACHGPGSNHNEWAARTEDERRQDSSAGLTVALTENRDVNWLIDAGTGSAIRSKPRVTETELNMCTRCHSRRSLITDDYLPGDDLLNTHRPALLDENLYHADGQILDEVYVYGSFRQSRMYQAGVTCSDCHDVHSLQLKGTLESVCLRCHQAEKFDSVSHHFHEPASPGASCVACHMPETKYMVIDPRRDHSLRIPRPDLSVKLGTPNACNQCHVEQTNRWSLEAVQQWYGKNPTGFQNFAEAIDAGRKGEPGSVGLLMKLVMDENNPAIARATGLSLLVQFSVPQAMQLVSNSLYDDDPVMRLAGLQSLGAVAPELRYRLAAHMLKDSIRAVRIEAGRLLAGTEQDQLTSGDQLLLKRVLSEYIDSQKENSDRAESLVNIGNLYATMAMLDKAESFYLQAIRLMQQYIPAYVNLADLYRMSDREVSANAILRQGLELMPGQASLHHALGLSLVRSKQLDKAVKALARASELAPEYSRYSYIYAVALEAEGNLEDAVRVLVDAYERDKNAQDILAALISYLQKAGNNADAQKYARQMEDWQRQFGQSLQGNP
jgi:tetratricopeptide (TPR) repeat protein